MTLSRNHAGSSRRLRRACAAGLAVLVLPLGGCGFEHAVRGVVRQTVSQALKTPVPVPASGESESGVDPTETDSASIEDISALIPEVPDPSAAELAKRIASDTPLSRLTPFQSGPGLVVLEPVANTKDPELHSLGQGAAAWLHLTVAGQPAFGQSPAFSSIGRSRREMNAADTAMALPQARDLARRVGATHVAVGTIAGSASAGRLSYRIYRVDNGQPVGSAASASGSEAQIAAALPGVARTLNAALRGSPSRIPSSTGLSASDMALLGRCRWLSWDTISDADDAGLKRLSLTVPIAGVLYLSIADIQTQTEVDQVALAVARKSADNPIALDQIGDSSFGLTQMASRIDADFQSSPHNALYAHNAARVHRLDHQSLKERKAAEAVVRAAPGNPESWLTLGWTISQEADAVRNARTMNMMTPTEQQFVSGLYPDWLLCVRHAVKLDPQYGKGWTRVAQAATFDGDGEIAADALRKALKYDPDRAEVYAWGLQMYQEKWGGDASSLAAIAHKASADQYPDCVTTLTVVGQLKDARQDADAGALLSRYMASVQDSIAKGVNAGRAHWRLAACLRDQGDLRRAMAEYTQAEQLLPGYPGIHSEAGGLLDKLGDAAGAVKEYQAAIALDPDSGSHFDLGWDLKHLGQYPAAQSELAAALKLDPYSSGAHLALAEVYQIGHNLPQAAVEYGHAADLPWPAQQTYDGLIFTLDNTHQYARALTYAKAGLIFYPRDLEIVDNIADVYLNLHKPQGALRMSRYALTIQPRDDIAYENIAEGDLQLKKMDEARANWRKVVQMGKPATVGVARNYLAKYGG